MSDRIDSKDDEQDALIRRNAESIRRNEFAIQRQTECLEKIRDHYFPHRSLLKRCWVNLLKIIGVVLAYAGLMETVDWYWNTRVNEKLAKESAAVAKRLFIYENDSAGAANFLARACELDPSDSKYRIQLSFLKGIAAIADLFDLGRPFTAEERARICEIRSESIFQQEANPDEPMAFVLYAQAQMLLGEKEASLNAVKKAISLDAKNPIVRFNACAMNVAAGNVSEAKAHIAVAEKINPNLPFVHFWKGSLAHEFDKDTKRAKEEFDIMLKLAPGNAFANYMLGALYLESSKPNLKLAREHLNAAIKANPNFQLAQLMLSDVYEQEGNLIAAHIWLNQIIVQDPNSIKALLARARICEREGDAKAAVTDLTQAIALAPFRADLYESRARLSEAVGDKSAAERDRKIAKAISQ